MSLETDSWRELTQDQATFFSGQLRAVNQLSQSPTAHEAGITPLRARSYAIKIDNKIYGSTLWPDPNQRDTVCIAMGGTGSSDTQAFAHVKTTPEGYEVEGLALGLNYYAQGSNLYGKQLILRHDMEEGSHVQRLGGNFLVTALKKSPTFRDRLNDSSQPSFSSQPLLWGIESTTSARLFRSISSIASNLLISGMVGEKGVFTDHTYDLAQSLLKVATNGIVANQKSDHEMIIQNSNGHTTGVAFESQKYGITLVLRIDENPATIAMITGLHSGTDNSALVGQYSIRPDGVTHDAILLDGEHSNSQTWLSTFSALRVAAKKEGRTTPPDIDEDTNRLLQQKIVHLLTERVHQDA